MFRWKDVFETRWGCVGFVAVPLMFLCYGLTLLGYLGATDVAFMTWFSGSIVLGFVVDGLVTAVMWLLGYPPRRRR